MNRILPNLILAAAALALLIVFVQACDSGRDRGPQTGSSPGAGADVGKAAAQPDGAGATGPTLDEGPRSGGEFRMPLGGIRVLDPAISTSLNEQLVLHQIFQGLVRFDERLRVVPDLAERWSLSKDRRTYTFRLRTDARFHHGRTVEAEDVAFSLHRLIEPRTKSPARHYFIEMLDGGADAITANPDGSCTIRLREPDHVFISILAMQYAKIVPRELAIERSFRREPIGSGPFRFAGREGGHLVLEPVRVDDDPRPYLDRLVFAELGFDEEAGALSRGELDYVIRAADELDELPGIGTFERRRVSTLSLHYVGMNLRRAPFDDKRVRQAVAYAIDRAAFGTVLQGRVNPASGVLPPGMLGFDPELAPYPHDPALARALLREAGYGSFDGGKPFPEVEVLLGRIPEQIALSEKLVADLDAVGIGVHLEITDDYGEFLGRLEQSDMAVMGWGADYPDPDNFFFNLFRTDGPTNFMGYSNPEVDRLTDEGRHGSSAKLDRALLYRQAERTLLEDCPIVPLFHDAAVHCLDPHVRGLTVNSMGLYYSRFDTVWMDRPDPQRDLEAERSRDEVDGLTDPVLVTTPEGDE